MTLPTGASSETPLRVIASTLDRLLRTPGFLGETDRVTVKYFGSVVRTAAETKEESLALLRQLASGSVPQGQFNDFTDFGKLFEDIRDRVKNAAGERQIIAIASDLAHDRVNAPATVNNAQQRNDEFDSILSTYGDITDILKPQSPLFGRVRIVGFKVPQGRGVADAEVAVHVENALKNLGIRIRRFDEDPAEAARTLSLELAGTIAAAPSAPGAAAIGAGNRVQFVLTNTTCVPVTVTALRFDRVQTPIEIAPVRLEQEPRTVMINASALDAIWNSTTTVEPALEQGATAHTAKSEEFWLGDLVRFQAATPVVVERLGRKQTLLVVNGDLNLYQGGSVTIRGVSGDATGRRFALEPMVEKKVVFSFPSTDTVGPRQQQTAAASTSISISVDGPRLISATDAAPTTQKNVTIGREQPSQAGPALTFSQWASVFLWVCLLVGTVLRSAVRVKGQRLSKQITGVSARLLRVLLLPPAGYFVLQKPLGEFFIEPLFDSPLWLAATIRGLVAMVLIAWLIRRNIVSWTWGALIEPKLLPNAIAVERRNVTDIAILLIAFGVLSWILYAVLKTPEAIPPFNTRILTGGAP